MVKKKSANEEGSDAEAQPSAEEPKVEGTISGLVDAIQTGSDVVEEPKAPEVQSHVDPKKTWQRLAPGELPRVGEPVICLDGPGKVQEIQGPNCMTKLDNGYLNWGGIDQLKVLR